MAHINQKTGFLEKFSYNGIDLIIGEVKPNLWRPLTDNDRLGQPNYLFTMGMFSQDCLDEERQLLDLSTSKCPDGSVQVQSIIRLPNGADGEGKSDFDYSEFIQTLKIHPSGDLFFEIQFENKTDLPRFGLQFQLPADLGHQMKYFGLGPHENYCDRKESAIVGIYEGPAHDFLVDYVYPQENGNRTEVRWLSLLDPQERGLLFQGMPFISCSVWPYSASTLERARHINELSNAHFLTVNIDLKQMGVGGYDSWSERSHPLPEHAIPPGSQHFKIWLKPYLLQRGSFEKVLSIPRQG